MIIGLTGCEEQSMSYTQISMEEARSLMEEETDYIILDVRTAEEFAGKHIPGAINIPNETIGSEEVAELQDKNQFKNKKRQSLSNAVFLGEGIFTMGLVKTIYNVLGGFYVLYNSMI